MTAILQALDVANDWTEYYAAYTTLYRQVVESRWALGHAQFANQLHHTAIPDAVSSTVGLLGWAAYSQPSAETLRAFLPLFSESLRREPHRIRANRYVLFVPRAPALTFSDLVIGLDEIAKRLDVWSTALDSILSWPSVTGPLDGLNAVFARDTLLVSREDVHGVVEAFQKQEALASLRRRLLERELSSCSIIAPMIRRAYLESSFVLTAANLGLSPESIHALCEDQAGIGACIAANRAANSGWPRETIDVCRLVMTRAPIPTTTHTVAPGDILTRLVRQFCEQSFESLWPLLQVLNPHITDPNVIRVGQRIYFPRFR